MSIMVLILIVSFGTSLKFAIFGEVIGTAALGTNAAVPSDNISNEYPLSQLPLDTNPVQDAKSIVEQIIGRQYSTDQGSGVEASKTDNSSEEMRAVWFSYMDWQHYLKDKTEEEFRSNIREIFNNMQSIHLNTIIIHASAFQDAMYTTDQMPVSASVSSDESLSYDAFALVIEEAQQMEIMVHAWINPMRALTSEQFSEISDVYQIKQWYENEDRGQYMLQADDGRWWLNPGNEEVRKYIGNIAFEITQKYSIAALHIDDYFYPSAWDQTQDMQYYESCGSNLSIEDWRRENTTLMVKELYDQVKAAKEEVLFGISPQANLQNNYEKMFIDVSLWLTTTGYVDYIMPQVYFGFENENLPFASCALEWNALIKNESIRLYIGLSAYKIGVEDAWAGDSGKDEWKNNSDILKRSVDYARKLNLYNGFGLFSYSTIFDEIGLNNAVSAEIGNLEVILK